VLDHLSAIGVALVIAVAPFVLVLTTCFTRISIVLTFLKQALSASVPSAHVIVALSLILTGYIMHPVFLQIHHQAVQPYMNGELEQEPPAKQVSTVLTHAWPPLRQFMLYHTREKDLQLFLDMSHLSPPEGEWQVETLPWYCVIPAFVLSELRTAFVMGFLLFLPFFVIDMVVASLLMSMGMILLPPVMISFPFKLLLFIAIDGWRFMMQHMVQGYS